MLAGGASGAGPELWPADYAGEAILNSLPVDSAMCLGVGPVVHQHGSNLFAEFVCTTGGLDSPQELLAIKPGTDTTFVQLDPAKASARDRCRVDLARRPDAADRGRQPAPPRDRTARRLDLEAHRSERVLIGWRGDDQVTIQPGNFYNVVD